MTHRFLRRGIFLRHISGAFEAKRAKLLKTDPASIEDQDEYQAENIFWVPKEARWSRPSVERKAAYYRKAHRR